MNWVDGVIILLLCLFTFEGVGKTFFSESINFLSILLAFFLSLRFFNVAASILQNQLRIPHSLANVIGFVLIWFFSEVLFLVALHFIIPKLKWIAKFESGLNPVAFIPAFLRGLVFISVILVLVGTFPIQPRIKTAVNDSLLGSFILSRTHQLETPLKNIFGGLTNDALGFFTIKPETNETVDLGFKTTNFSVNPLLESKMIELVNEERIKRGLSSLKFNAKLQSIARDHSADMFKRGYFSHYTPEGKNVANRADDVGFTYLVIGENLAYAPTLELAHTGLMNSPGHRANILSVDYTQIGIGIMESKDYGLMITQVFSN